jgi:aminodeoxyfutalosine synthase
MPIADVLSALRDAGLGSLPGGGAEIFDDRVHDEVFKGKVREDKWFEVHRTAHALGIYSNATMLYGHVETSAERVGHLIKLRELQAESLANMGTSGRGTGILPVKRGAANGDPGNSRSTIHGQDAHATACFNCCIPLSFIPENSELGALPGPTGLTDLKTLAIARLMLHNIPHIKAFWIMQGVGLSQIALDWGCDDLDGTVVWYDITKRQGQGTTHQELHVEDIKRLIRESGKTPVERNTLYRPIKRQAPEDQLPAAVSLLSMGQP